MAAATPFRVRHGAGAAWLPVLLAPDATSADVKEAVAATVGLAVGTFAIQNAEGVKSVPHAALAGDWDVVLLALQPQQQPPPRAAQALAPAAADAIPHSVSEAVGPTFEHEARVVIGSVLREVCPWVSDHSAALSRVLDRDGNAREGDIMCYLQGDTLTRCVPAPAHGVAVVSAPAGAAAAEPLPPLALPAGSQFSPTDASRLGPHKYFVAEAYSGANPARMRAKVAQLETLVGYMLQRWAAQHESAPAAHDVTQLVGAAARGFSVGDEPRHTALSSATALVEGALAAGGGSGGGGGGGGGSGAGGGSAGGGGGCENLRRLAAAGRLLVVVLDKRQSPFTHFQRAVVHQFGALDERLARVLGEVAQRIDARLAAWAEALEAAKQN